MILATPKTTAGGVTSRRAGSLLLGLAGICLLASLFLPIWHITLDAPQYPEGMGMFIWARTLTGENPHDLDIINQLNHYIGMRPIVPESIPELKIIAPLIAFFSLACFAAAIRPRTWVLLLLLAGLSGAGALGMYDFWKWEYDYGHNLDPRAAIQIPGQNYQPPLIGTAKLLNFTSTSWPATGGLLLFAAGGLIAGSLLLLWSSSRRRRSPGPASGLLKGPWALFLAVLVPQVLSGCRPGGPEPIDWGFAACHHCKMSLVQRGFPAQRLTAKGKTQTFDSIECLLEDLKAHPAGDGERFFVSDWSRPEANVLPAGEAHFLQGDGIPSPMGGHLAGFASADSAASFQARVGGELQSWADLAANRSP